MNVVDVWLVYKGITRTAKDQADLYNYLSEDIIDNTYYWFMMRSSEGRRKTIVDSDDKTFDDNNPLFVRINGAPRCVTALHVTATKRSSKNWGGTETQYLLQGSARSSGRRHVCVFGLCGHRCSHK